MTRKLPKNKEHFSHPPVAELRIPNPDLLHPMMPMGKSKNLILIICLIVWMHEPIKEGNLIYMNMNSEVKQFNAIN